MSKLTAEEKAKYSHRELPKVKNIITYNYLCFGKIFSYVVFYVGAVILAVFVFPFIRLFHWNKENFGIRARVFVSRTFRVFIKMMKAIGVIKLRNEDLEEMQNLHGNVIVANHPSALDFVFILSFMPKTTCIVRGSLTKTPLRGVIKQAYITNTTTFEEMCDECKKLLDEGCNVLIFPEGTRTPRHGKNNYKKGAARIALRSGADVRPILVGGSDKYSLGKHDPIWSYNHVEQLFYDFKLLPKIDISEYKDLSESIAAKHLTDKIEEMIVGAGREYAENHPLCRTVNNI